MLLCLDETTSIQKHREYKALNELNKRRWKCFSGGRRVHDFVSIKCVCRKTPHVGRTQELVHQLNTMPQQIPELCIILPHGGNAKRSLRNFDVVNGAEKIGMHEVEAFAKPANSILELFLRSWRFKSMEITQKNEIEKIKIHELWP